MRVTRLPYLGRAQPALYWEAPQKGGVKKAWPDQTWLVHHGQWVFISAVRRTRKLD